MSSAIRSDTLPLIGHGSGSSVLAWRNGRPVTAGHFLSEVRHLAARLPPGRHLLNVCTDRHHFAVGLCAALLAGKVSLLPSTQTPGVIRWLREFAADAHCLTDDPACTIDLPRLQYPADERVPAADWEVPRIGAGNIAAIVFTSGSTGTPVPHAKSWGKLVRCVSAEAQRLGVTDSNRPAVLGTVPPQHMYGFETAVLMPLLGGAALCAEKPFYPADIAAALQALPRPRMLVTTPVHLRAVLQAGVELPAIDLCVCATAPLEDALAKQTENTLAAPLIEIFGSTETGQIATRRPAREAGWELWPDVRLRTSDGRTLAEGGHVEVPVAVNDIIEMLDEHHFLLHGRSTDLVNIAGKRSSFGYLNHQINAIEGVRDGAFFLQDAPTSAVGVSRLGAIVVAPGLAPAAILGELRKRIDAVFMPRPLLFAERLPRNETGKLPQDALDTLARSLLRQASS